MPRLVPVPENEDVLIECCSCGDKYDENTIIKHDDDSYCEDCHRDNFICCEECSNDVLNEDAIEACNSWFCSTRCARRYGLIECADCDEWFVDNDGYQNAHGNSICSSCVDNYYPCDGCGDIIHVDNICDDNYCRDCYDSRQNDGIIKDYDWQPAEFIFDKMPWENTMYLGIELEVECGEQDNVEIATKVMKWLEEHKVNDRVYIKDDGSLDNGFELVFMPSTLQAIHKRFPMREFLTYLKRIGLTSEEPGTCGLHVHLSKTKMADRDLYAGKLFFYKCADQLLKLSARSFTSYCKFDDECPVDGLSQENGRYSAFNTCATRHTVEIRIFRGTLEYNRFQASLQFSDLFGEYIQHISVGVLKKAESSLIWADFLAYGKRKARYQQFLTYCKTKGIS